MALLRQLGRCHFAYYKSSVLAACASNSGPEAGCSIVTSFWVTQLQDISHTPPHAAYVLFVFCRAAKSTPAAPASSTGGQPQPPIGALSPDQVRDKVKAALIRLANNEAFVNSLAQELRTVGLLQ